MNIGFNRNQMFVLLVQTWILRHGKLKDDPKEDSGWALEIISRASMYELEQLPWNLAKAADEYCSWHAGLTSQPEWVAKNFNNTETATKQL